MGRTNVKVCLLFCPQVLLWVKTELAQSEISHRGWLSALSPKAECRDYVGFFSYLFLRSILLTGPCCEHAFHTKMGRKVWVEGCTSHGAVGQGTCPCLSPTDRANVQNLGNPIHPQHCSRRQGDEPEKRIRENLHLWESSQGAETPETGPASQDHQIT